MGLKAIAQAAAQTAFSLAGDIKKTCQYSQIIDDGLDEDVTPTIFSIDVIFGEFSRAEMAKDDNIQPGDVLGSVLVSVMQVEPVKGDLLVDQESGTEYRVEAWSKDTAEALYELHMRAL